MKAEKERLTAILIKEKEKLLVGDTPEEEDQEDLGILHMKERNSQLIKLVNLLNG